MTRKGYRRYTDTIDILDLVREFYGKDVIIHDLAIDKNQIAIIDVEFIGGSENFKQNIPCLEKVDQDE